ncbi:MAG: alpha/beta hydrolase fold domain-containing protein, partial [Microthrixaceae bacterium]
LAPAPETNLAYGPVRGCPQPPDEDCAGSQTLDVWRSAKPGPNPVLLWVHGGAGVSGDKTEGVPEQLQRFIDDGYDVVSVNYRLAQEDGTNVYPVGLQDVKRAVRWVKANAAAQNWDPARVVAAGHSMGGNLVEMLATTNGVARLEPSDLPPDLAAQDSSITAALAIAPVSDLNEFRDGGWIGGLADVYMGCTQPCPDRLAEESVAPYVTPAAAPVLAVHGVLDPWATVVAGRRTREAYRAAGIGDRFELVLVGEGPAWARGHAPDLNQVMDRIVDFVERR